LVPEKAEKSTALPKLEEGFCLNVKKEKGIGADESLWEKAY